MGWGEEAAQRESVLARAKCIIIDSTARQRGKGLDAGAKELGPGVLRVRAVGERETERGLDESTLRDEDAKAERKHSKPEQVDCASLRSETNARKYECKG